uniref:Dynamin-2A-like n=1 Tax=Rhizophora mucronata TaxID=61149 RepID=A0A2P2MEG4_RHIMU
MVGNHPLLVLSDGKIVEV